jgi:hypothetical protein
VPVARRSVKRFGNRLLAYVDILGWSDLVRQRRTPDVFNWIGAGLFVLGSNTQVEAARKRIFESSKIPHGTTIETGFFSDTFVCSCRPDRNEASWLVDRVQKLCMELLGNGLYPRGAIVVGDLLHTGDGTIVGQALLDAHAIERSVAKYPRLIVADAAEHLLVRLVSLKPRRFSPIQVRVDRADGLKFLDVFPTRTPGRLADYSRDAITRAKKSLRWVQTHSRLGRDVRTLNIRAKHRWMSWYLDEVAAELVDSATPEP